MARAVLLCAVALRVATAWCPKKLKPIDSEDCPSSLPKFCDDVSLEEGDFCAGSRAGNAVCGTDVFLNNCVIPAPPYIVYWADIYEVKKYGVDPFCPKKLEPVEIEDCPAELDIGNCNEAGLKKGDLCEGDGECDTNRALNNCFNDYISAADIYLVKKESEACVDSQTWYYKHSPSKDCAWAGKSKSKCKKKDLLTKTKARDACPLSCGEC